MIPAALPPITPSFPDPTPGPASGGGSSFADTLRGALDGMEQLQTSATHQVAGLIDGTSTDVHTGMIAVEKADLAFAMMLQLRNKAVEAYQDISHMAF